MRLCSWIQRICTIIIASLYHVSRISLLKICTTILNDITENIRNVPLCYQQIKLYVYKHRTKYAENNSSNVCWSQKYIVIHSCDIFIYESNLVPPLQIFMLLKKILEMKYQKTAICVLHFNTIKFHTFETLPMLCTFKLVAFLLAKLHCNGEERIECTYTLCLSSFMCAESNMTFVLVHMIINHASIYLFVGPKKMLTLPTTHTILRYINATFKL